MEVVVKEMKIMDIKYLLVIIIAINQDFKLRDERKNAYIELFFIFILLIFILYSIIFIFNSLVFISEIKI